jgi:hypothetical protein
MQNRAHCRRALCLHRVGRLNVLRFRQLTRDDFFSEACAAQISCGACFAKGHNRSHPILMAREVMDEEGEPETDRPIHAGIACSYCAMDPIVGTRYKCVSLARYASKTLTIPATRCMQ